jgi:S-formylglutathione hydrolase FrmB
MKKMITTSILFSLLFIFFQYGYSQTTQPSDFEPTAFVGSTVVDSIYSPALEGNLQGNPSTQPVKVYLPPHYENFPDNRYPVVYLLHPGDICNYNYFYSADGLLEIVNQLIFNKTIVPMIIVTPNATTEYGNSCYTNSYVTGNWEDYIVQNVIGHVESKYLVLDQRDSRGLSGFSIGGHGTVKIAMKHPSLFNSIGLIGPGAVNFEDEWLNTPMWRDAIIAAAGMEEFDPDAEGAIPLVFAHAVAFAPDSTNKPILGRFPYTADGVFIDSIWQKYLEHDPLTMLQSYADSLHKINAIQFYIGDKDEWVSYGIGPFLQALQNNGIEYGHEIYSGTHDSQPVLDDLLEFFSEQLIGTVPTNSLLNDYYLENIDTLVAEMNMDGKLYIVPLSAGIGLDSIYMYQVAASDALANEKNEFQLSGYDFGKYRVFAVSVDSVVSNIPEEFCVVPDKLPPDLDLVSDTVNIGNSISVSMNRDGNICLVTHFYSSQDTFRTVSEIMNSYRLIECADAQADTEVSFSTEGLSTRSYWIYGYDQYGIVSEPYSVDIITSMRTHKTINKLTIHPNPSNDIINIEIENPNNATIEIYNVTGKLVFSKEIDSKVEKIDVSGLSAGIYIVKVMQNSTVYYGKVMVR